MTRNDRPTATADDQLAAAIATVWAEVQAAPDIPINYCTVTAEPSYGFWAIRVPECVLCGGVHSHGGGSLDSPPRLGHRGAHCVDLPRDNKGYMLVPIEIVGTCLQTTA